MSWRSSNDFRSPNSPRRDSRDTKSALDPTMRLMIIGGVALVVIVIGIIVAVNLAGSQGGGTTVAAQPTSAAPAATATTAPTVAPVATSASAPVIVSSRATATPAPTVSPADAGPLETTGDAEVGRALFNSMPAEKLLAGAVLCYTCHNVDPGSDTLVGPSLSGVATRAETRVPILSPAQYLRVSITVPNSYVVEGFLPGTMTQTFAKALTPEEIEDLVAYLLTLKE